MTDRSKHTVDSEKNAVWCPKANSAYTLGLLNEPHGRGHVAYCTMCGDKIYSLVREAYAEGVERGRSEKL